MSELLAFGCGFVLCAVLGVSWRDVVDAFEWIKGKIGK